MYGIWQTVIYFISSTLIYEWKQKFLCGILSQQPIIFIYLYTGLDLDAVRYVLSFELIWVLLQLTLYYDMKIEKMHFYEKYIREKKLNDWNIILDKILPIQVAIINRETNKCLYTNLQFKKDYQLVDNQMSDEYNNQKIQSILLSMKFT